MKKKGLVCIILLFVILCLIPLVFYPVRGREAAESSDVPTALPALVKTVSDAHGKTENVFNQKFLSDAGDYFTGTFAFRNELVTADSALRSGIFHTSTKSNVVIGKDGFLFYGSTMDDYLGRTTLTDLQLSQIAYNLSLMQRTLEEDGKTFVFTIAPNKNSLYPQYMPSGYKTDRTTANYTRLVPYLEKAGVNYVNLHAFFSGQDEVYYHKTDSHWNNKGAALANRLLLKAVGRKSTDYDSIPCEARNDMTGDLFRMLYPAAKGQETEYYYQKERDYDYVEEIESTYDPEILTDNRKKDGSLVMFRDSFGNALVPFTADEYGSGFFSRALPYQVYQAYDREADTVIAELVERNLYYLQSLAPVLPAHDRLDLELPETADPDLRVTAQVEPEEAGEHELLKVTGQIDPKRMKADADTYISLYDKEQDFGYIFQVYHCSEQKPEEDESEAKKADRGEQENGYAVYLDPVGIADGNYEISLLHENEGRLIRSKEVAQYEIG